MQLLPLLAQNSGEPFAFGFFILIVLFGLAMLGIWIWALVDAINNPSLNQNERLIWILVIVLVGILGAIIYLLMGRGSGSSSRRL